jgi:hypothetical protein
MNNEPSVYFSQMFSLYFWGWPGKQNENIQAHIRQINVNPIEEILVKLMVNSVYFRTQYLTKSDALLLNNKSVNPSIKASTNGQSPQKK